MESDQHIPEHLTLEDSYACFRPLAKVTLNKAVEMVDNAIRFCRSNGIAGLLVDITGFSGFPPPSITEKYWLIQKWAESSSSKVVVSMVAPREFIDHDKIGNTMADNRGFSADVFAAESDAVAWIIANIST